MPTVKLKLGSKTLNLSGAGDLLKLVDPSSNSPVFRIAGALAAIDGGRTIAEIGELELKSGLSVEEEAKWTLKSGPKISFSLKAGAEVGGSVVLRKKGELLSYRDGRDPDKKKSIQVSKPIPSSWRARQSFAPSREIRITNHAPASHRRRRTTTAKESTTSPRAPRPTRPRRVTLAVVTGTRACPSAVTPYRHLQPRPASGLGPRPMQLV